jgi:GSH-dependent disulfide-bond oxidoreductase
MCALRGCDGSRSDRSVLEVYTWEPNANAGKPLLCLKEKGVEFVYHYVDIGRREQHSPDFLKINPNGTVPAVVHEGVVFTESTPAMEYIDEAFEGPPLRPADPYLLWRMRKWCRFMDSNLCPAMAMIASHATASARFSQQDPEELRRAIDRVPLPERKRSWSLQMFNRLPKEDLAESARRVDAAIGAYEAALAEYPYLAGPKYSLADINALCTIYALPLQRPEQVNEERTPHFMDWYRRCHERPAIQAAFEMGHDWVAGRVREMRRQLGIDT